jgi:hypothetical protein
MGVKTINVPLHYFGALAGTLRVVPGRPERSALLLRMRDRGDRTSYGGEVQSRTTASQGKSMKTFLVSGCFKRMQDAPSSSSWVSLFMR